MRRRARRRRRRPTGVLVDEQFGARHPGAAPRPRGLKLAMPVEKSGQDEFDFEYGDEFGEHILSVRPRLLQGARPLQPRRRRRDEPAPARPPQAPRATGCTRNDRKFLFELLVPGRARPARVRRRRHRPLRRRAAPRADAPRDRRRSRTSASRSTSGRSRASTSATTPRCSPSRPAAATGRERRRRACCSAAAPPTTKVDHWLAAGRAGRGLRRLRDRPLDLVGRAEGLPRRRPRARARRPSRSPRTTCASSRSTSEAERRARV